MTTQNCEFCSGKYKVEDVNDNNLDFFDSGKIAICEKHINKIHDKIAEGKI
jgi:hypothetical protein